MGKVMVGNAQLQGMVEEKWSGRADGYSDIVNGEMNGFQKGAWLAEIDKLTRFGADIVPRVLDIGTGPGFFAIILSQRGWKVTGVDCVPEMLGRARANSARYGVAPEFLPMDSHALAFGDGGFDLLLSRNVTWTLYDPVAAYGEWRRVLRPGGQLLIFDANWYRHLFDGRAMELKRRAEREAYERFKLTPFEESDPEMAKVMYSSLPMGRNLRPDWDVERLKELGFRDIEVDLDISERVWDEESRVRYSDTPLFAIRAVKG